MQLSLATHNELLHAQVALAAGSVLHWTKIELYTLRIMRRFDHHLLNDTISQSAHFLLKNSKEPS